MNLNRSEWSKAQDLLVQLVQILTPLAEKDSASVLNNRFFVPPGANDDPLAFRHPVRVLHFAQQQVAEWIEQLPAPTVSQRGGEGGSAIDRAPARPLSTQAQKLIDQVRNAICSLCTSSNIVEPKAAPLREALLKIKPYIDEMVQAVTHEGMHSSDDEPNPHSPLTSHRFSREVPKTKRLPLPQDREKLQEETPFKHSVHATGPSPKQGVHRFALPGAPFIPEARSLTPARKKAKKKESRPFRQDEEKSDNNTNYQNF